MEELIVKALIEAFKVDGKEVVKMGCPCQDCPHRKLTCHDHCDEYAEWHDIILTAKEAIWLSQRAVDLLIDGTEKRKRRRNRRKK